MDQSIMKSRIYELADEFYKEVKDQRDETNLVQMYSINSIDSIEFLLILEEEYDIEFDDDDLNIESLMNIDHLTELIASKFETEI